MAIDLGKFDKKKNYGRGISLGVFDKIPEDLDFDAFKREYIEREKRSIGDSVWEWADAFPTGVDQMIDSAKESMTNKSVVKGMFNFADFDEMKDAWKTVGLTAKIGLADEWHTYRAIKNNIQNELSSSSQDDKIRKAYELRKFRENYFNVDRENMLSEVPKEFRADADFGADFLTPTNLLPAFFGKKVIDKPVRASIKGGVKGVSLVAKGAEKLSEGIEKGLGYPTKKLDELMPKGGIAYRGAQMVALASDTGIGTMFGSMVFVEGLAKVAKKTSREISEVTRVFAQPSSHARFLYRLSTDEAVSASTRKLAARMYKLRGTRAYDILFDGLVAGLSSSAMQSAMEFAQGSSAEEMGQASGAGLVLGAPVGMVSGSRNSGKADEDRSDLSINNYLEKKANQQNKDTVKALKKLDRDTLISLSTMDEFAELGDYNMQLMDHKNFKKQILGEDESVDSKNLPAASYNQETKVILLDESKLKEGTEKARKIVMHEIGHAYMREMLGSNPLMRRKILEKFEDENGREYFFKDLDGVKNGSIKVNKQAENFMREYALLMGVKPEDFAKSKYADNAFLLAEEIGAEQFSALMRETPNVFKRYEKSFRHSLLNAGKDVLSKLGIIDADSGNLIDSPISVSLRKNKDVQNLFTNYMQARNDHYRMRADDIEKGRKHEPRKGQDSSNRFTELFGGHGINIGLGAHFSVKDRQMFNELIKAAELDAQGADSDLTGIGKNFEGKRLGAKTKDIFRKAGANGGGAMNIIDFFQNAIDTRSMIKFGYRSAKWWDRSHYNPFYERSFTGIGWQISPKKPTTRLGRTIYPNLKIVGYDADLIMSNAELLSQAGFLKGKYKDTAEFLDAFSEHAESLLQQTGEKSINPLGQGENELFVAALGRIAGEKFIPKIQDPELSDFFTDPNSKLKQAYRSYDVGGMAGVTSLNKKGLAFNYSNAKHNYMPSLSGAGSEGSTIPRTLYMPRSVYSGTLDQRGLEHNLFEKILPNIKQEKFTPEQLMSEVNKNKGAQEFLDDIGITKDVLEEIKVKKTISKSALEFLINANQKIIDLEVESSKGGEALYEGYLEKGDYTNYEEMVFVLPESEKYIGDDNSGGHWENPRVLFHVRKSDRTLPNGEATYHVEEIQSDWHQHARRVGYADSPEVLERFGRIKELSEKIQKLDRGYDHAINDEVLFVMNENKELIREAERWILTERNRNYFEKHPEELEGSINEHVDFVYSDRRDNEGYQRYKYLKEKISEYKKHIYQKQINKVARDGAVKAEADGLFPQEGEINFFDLNYESQLTDKQFEVWERSFVGDTNTYSSKYYKHRKLLSEPDPYENGGSFESDVQLVQKLTTLGAEVNEVVNNKENLRDNDTELQAMRKERRELDNRSNQAQSPAPMKNSYHSRALAEAINNAWKEGKRYLTWVTGERSAQQNRLDEHFDFVNVEQGFGKYRVHAQVKDGRSIRRNVETADELAKLIGKDAAKQAVDRLKGEATGTKISVHDVEKKHEGRRVFYDKVMVSSAKRFAKFMGTRPPMKSKIVLAQSEGMRKTMSSVNMNPEQEVWLMELPKEKPVLPLYMPSSPPRGEGTTTSGLVRNKDRSDRLVSVHAQELWRSPEQTITSADTSINDKKLPTGFTNLIKKNIFKKNQIVVDIGGGKFDNAVDKLKSIGAYLHVYDPFNRSIKHNEAVIKKVADGGADVAVSNNTLNVIAEDKNIITVIAQSHNALRDNGKAYFTVYEGDRSGMGKVTSKGFQRNLPTQSYIDMVKEVYGNDVKKEGNVIVATKKPLKLVKEDILFKQSGEDTAHGHVPSVIRNADDSLPLYIPNFLEGEPIMPIVGDRLMASPFTARSGKIFECRGGHDHPLVKDHKGQVAWACGQSGSEPDNVALGLMRAIEQSPNGYAATLLMHPQAHVSNRTFSRIVLDEMIFDAMNAKDGEEIVFKHAEDAIALWNAKMKKDGKDKLLDRTNLKTFQDLAEHMPTIPFQQRKDLVLYLFNDAYKKKIKKAGGFDPINWRDLVKRTGQYMPEDGYQIGDMIHIIKFDTSNPIIDLKEIGATPDPTYDISFRGKHVHTFEGKVSAYDLFKGSLDYFAYDPVWTAENKKVPDAVRTVEKGKIGSDAFQMFRYHGTKPQMRTPVTQENTIPASRPLNYTAKTKKENMYLDNRRKENTKIRKRKLAELKG